MAFTTFPIEVIEAIIDLIASEDDALFSSVKLCSLVSRSLLPRTRRYIFRVITLKYVTDSYGTPTYTTPRFVRLISRSPGIARYVRILDYSVAKQDLNVEGLAVALGNLTNVQSLKLTGPMRTHFDMGWAEFPCLETILKLMHSPTLSHLRLRTIGSFPLSCLALCKGLKFLDMEFLFGSQMGNIELFQEQPPCLESLVVFVDDIELLKKLCIARADGKPIVDISRLQNLSVSVGYTEVHPRDTLTLFRSCTRLVGVFLGGCQSLLPGISFAELFRPSIQTLQDIHVQFGLFGTNFDPVTLSVASEFASLTGNNIIKSIKISVYIYLPEEYTSYNHEGLWSPLDNVFTRSQSGWAKLQKVSLYIQLKVTQEYQVTDDYIDFVHDLHRLPETQMAGLMRSNIVFDFTVLPRICYW